LGDVGNPADIFTPVFLGKTEVAGEAMPDIVAVQHVAGVTQLDQPAFQFIGDRGLARPGQAREPDGDGLLPEHVRPVVVAYRTADTLQERARSSGGGNGWAFFRIGSSAGGSLRRVRSGVVKGAGAGVRIIHFNDSR
jgi:hypothetical protein